VASKSPAARIAGIVLFGVVLWFGCGQDPDRQARQDPEQFLAEVDTVFSELGGPATASLDRGQRWRMTRGILGQYLLSGMASAQVPSVEDIDSLVVYLQRNAMPVAEPEELGTGPEREFFVSRCGFCHETPSPLAHTAEEWPAVVGRMHSNMAMMSVRPLSDEEAKRVVSYLRERAPAARP
jgi:hypothetical protein